MLRAEGWASQLGGTPSKPGRDGQEPHVPEKGLAGQEDNFVLRALGKSRSICLTSCRSTEDALQRDRPGCGETNEGI